MAKSYEELLNQANEVSNETQYGANTAPRVGGLNADIIEKIKEVEGKIAGHGAEIITSTSVTVPKDDNLFSALAAINKFLRKDKEDSTYKLLRLIAGAVFGREAARIDENGIATFSKVVLGANAASIDASGFLTAVKAILQNIVLSGDLKSDNFLAGALGTGYALIKRDADGKSYLEVDKLFARVKAIFAVLEIMKVTYTGGNFVFSPAGMQCTKVEEYENYYRCYFTADDGEKAVENTFEVDDQVQLREFNVKAGVYENVANRYFWRRCIAKGDDYIDLSKTDRDMTSDDAPMAGDALVTMGNKTIKSRQNVIIISVYGEGSPSIIQYEGINTYSLDGKAKTVISPNGNKFTGSFTIQTSGKDVEQELSGLNDKIDKVELKSVLAEYSSNKIDWHPSFVEGDVWMRTSSNNGSTWTEAIRIVGERGPQGIPGQAGADGKVYYTWIRYADNAQGGGISNDPTGKKYIGFAYNKESQTESNNPSDYTWSLIKGDKGDQGVAGAKGADGKTYYTWIKYSDNSDGSGMYDVPTSSTLYIGIAVNKTTQQEGTDPSDYTWSRFKGEQGERGLQGLQGEKGEQGIPGRDGADGKTTYFHIKYSAVSNPTSSSQMTETPSTYIGTYVDFTQADSTDPSKYTWARFEGVQGEKGDQGIPGTNGANGQTSYLHIAYANSEDGSKDFSVSDSANKQYIGQYTDFTQADSSDYRKYSWSKIKGNDGSYVVIQFARNTSLTTAPTTGWSSTPPASQAGYYIWMRTGTVVPPATQPTTWNTPIRQTGETGVDGQNVYRLDLTNEVAGVAATADGTVSGTLPTTDMNVYDGQTLDSGWAFAATYSGCTGAISGKTLTIKTLTADTASVTITATKSGKPTLTSVMSIYKVKAGADGSAGRGVKSTTITYQASTSGTTAPTGTWSSTIPSVAANQYLWTRTVITYTDNTTSTSYSVGKMGATGATGAPGEDGDGIVSISTTYQIGSSATVAPTGTWSSTIPAAQKGKYLWARTITTYKKSDPTTAYSVSYYGTDGTNASYITVSGEQVMKYAANYSGTPTPSSITLTATLVGLSGYQWSYKQAGQTSFTNISGATASTYTLAHNASIWGSAKSITLRCTSGGKYDEVTIVKVADGAKGAAGDAGGDAYTIILGNESHTFAGTTNAAIAATTKVTVIAYKGATQIAATIGTPTGMPTGMTHTITSNGTTSAYITFAVTTAMTTANGVVNIPITADGKSFTKQFSYAISFKGSTGDAAVVYSIQPSATQVIKSSTGTLTPASVTCTKYKTIGNGAATITTEKTIKYQRLGVDSAEVAYNGAVTITAETKSVVFSLYDGSTLLDRENVPVLSDASDLMLGGVNLIPDSDNGFLDTLKIWPDNTAKYSYTDNDGWRRINLLDGQFTGNQIVHEKYLTTEVGVDFTFSVFLRTNGTITSKPYFRFRDRNTVHSKDVTATIEPRGSNMYRLWAACAGGLSDNLLVFQLMNFVTSGATYAEFRYPQLEYGNKPTPWREAPEDLGAKFEVLHDQIKSEIHAVEIHNKNLLLNSDIDMMDSAQGYNIGSEFYVNVQKTKDGWWRINCPDGVTDGEFFIEEYMEGLIQEGVYTESIEMRSDSNVVAGLQFYSKYGVYPIISSEQTKIGTNHWRLEGTFRVLYENAGVRKVDVAHISAPNATYVEFRFPMLTEGSEYVPWQPAAEDETGLRAHVTRHDSEISQLSDEISLMVSKTDYDENNQEISKQFSEIKQTATNISLKVDNTVDDLQETGIDILNKKIILQADNTVIQANDGSEIAMFTVDDSGKPLIKAEYIDAKNITAKAVVVGEKVLNRAALIGDPGELYMESYVEEYGYWQNKMKLSQMTEELDIGLSNNPVENKTVLTMTGSKVGSTRHPTYFELSNNYLYMENREKNAWEGGKMVLNERFIRFTNKYSPYGDDTPEHVAIGASGIEIFSRSRNAFYNGFSGTLDLGNGSYARFYNGIMIGFSSTIGGYPVEGRKLYNDVVF